MKTSPIMGHHKERHSSECKHTTVFNVSVFFHIYSALSDFTLISRIGRCSLFPFPITFFQPDLFFSSLDFYFPFPYILYKITHFSIHWVVMTKIKSWPSHDQVMTKNKTLTLSRQCQNHSDNGAHRGGGGVLWLNWAWIWMVSNTTNIFDPESLALCWKMAPKYNFSSLTGVL